MVIFHSYVSWPEGIDLIKKEGASIAMFDIGWWPESNTLLYICEFNIHKKTSYFGFITGILAHTIAIDLMFGKISGFMGIVDLGGFSTLW